MDAQTCTSIPNCYPETPTVTVQVGTSPVPVATLTSSALFSSLYTAISGLCLPSSRPNPPPTAIACSEEAKATINGIQFLVDDGDSGKRLDDSGHVVIGIGSSFASSISSMKALIGIAAQSFVSSASGNNCHVETWTQTNGLPRRWEGNLLDLREEGPGAGGSGGGGAKPPPQRVSETMTMCNMGSFSGPQYYAQNYREAAGPGTSAFIDVEASFHVTPDPGGNLIRDFIEAAAEAIEAEYTPELLLEEQAPDQGSSKYIIDPILVVPFILRNHGYSRWSVTDNDTSQTLAVMSFLISRVALLA